MSGKVVDAVDSKPRARRAGLALAFALLSTSALVAVDTRPAQAQFGIGIGIPGLGRGIQRGPAIRAPGLLRPPGGIVRPGMVAPRTMMPRGPSIGRAGPAGPRGAAIERLGPGRSEIVRQPPARAAGTRDLPVRQPPNRVGATRPPPGRDVVVRDPPTRRPPPRTPPVVVDRPPAIVVVPPVVVPVGPGGFGPRGPGGMGPGGPGFGPPRGPFGPIPPAILAVPAAAMLLAAVPPGGGAPPRAERRFVPDEVLFVTRPGQTPDDLDRLARRFRLSPIAEERIDIVDASVMRYRVPRGASVPDIVRAMERDQRVLVAQPNYIFSRPDYAYRLQSATTTPGGGASLQYVVETLRLPEAHVLSRGLRVPIAVIDSGVDPTHPELSGRIVKSFDAVGGAFQPHEHGTGMVGAIVSHAQLTGISPGADILAVRAFGPPTAGTTGTSMHILKSLDWSVAQGARVINMSFAGPRDPIISRALAVAAERRIALVAAMGNEGPRAPVSFPAADPNVIAVTATDQEGRLFDRSSRGEHVAVAAPGVDVLLPAPAGGYQISSGTSVAAAHVSGVAALVLERAPNLDPAELRRVIAATARPGATPGRVLGAGVIDPVPALSALPTGTPPAAPLVSAPGTPTIGASPAAASNNPAAAGGAPATPATVPR